MVISRRSRLATTKRVMLVDDHPFVRRGLRHLIEGVPDLEVCAEAADGHEAVKLASETEPDLLVMDLSMPGLDGINATIEIRKILPRIEVLVLTMHESDRLAGQALRAGARGYLLKSESEVRLKEALEALMRHQPYFSPSVSATLLNGYLKSEPTQDKKPLTPREREIVKLVAKGQSSKDIASLLDLSVKTVETHRASAMEKAGAKSVADLTLYAVRNDLVQI
jgi:DNA-binding NarL/FixJ family response regulator